MDKLEFYRQCIQELLTEYRKLAPMKNSISLWVEFLGMGNGEKVTNAQCPIPQATGRLSLSTHSWDGVSRRFQ